MVQSALARSCPSGHQALKMPACFLKATLRAQEPRLSGAEERLRRCSGPRHTSPRLTLQASCGSCSSSCACWRSTSRRFSPTRRSSCSTSQRRRRPSRCAGTPHPCLRRLRRLRRLHRLRRLRRLRRLHRLHRLRRLRRLRRHRFLRRLRRHRFLGPGVSSPANPASQPSTLPYPHPGTRTTRTATSSCASCAARVRGSAAASTRCTRSSANRAR